MNGGGGKSKKNGCGDTETGDHANAKSKMERYGQSMKPGNWGIL